jgi:Protein of unknown function (DUF2510)
VNPNEFGVASGWYPDPLGLPQLRWWDGQGWAEHTSEARAPIVEQLSTTAGAYAADAFPSRRAVRERERERAEFENEFEGDFDHDYDDEYDDDYVDDSDLGYDQQPVPSRAEGATNESSDAGTVGLGTVDHEADDDSPALDHDHGAQVLLEMTLKEFEPPHEQDGESTGGRAGGAESAFQGSGIPSARSAFDPSRFRSPIRPLRSYSVSAWLLSVIPLLQLVTVLVLVPVAGLGNNWPLVISAWVAPHLLAVGLAAHDRLTLMLWGHRNPASPRWALLTAMGYLVVRSRRVQRETGHGSPLLLILGLSSAALVAACVAIPGLVISVTPSFFVGELETVVTADARAGGASITVTCPESPPILLGESTSCTGLRSDGEMADIDVSLIRQNGWISWQVDEWNGLLDN